MKVLITGANRGIGAAMRHAFAEAGNEVQGTARDEEGLLPLDVTDTASVQALAKRLEGQPLDALVCNAGVFLDKGMTIGDDYDADMWAKGFAVNVTGVFLTIEALLPNLKLSDAPRIGIISSQMASDTRAPGKNYIYRASKAAVLNLGRNLATDLKDQGIAVGIYHPGWVQTDMGGDSAEITPEQSAEGLVARVTELSLENTGCFETYDGTPHPY
ncbi:SDR family oxidoreductase [Sagittula sp. SSi028]|uniref:SDR family oxidoreductase n=1 Tax=Sagittula sp. SSi028 TaxID=3400636 RepID=UPI003AF907CE